MAPEERGLQCDFHKLVADASPAELRQGLKSQVATCSCKGPGDWVRHELMPGLKKLQLPLLESGAASCRQLPKYPQRMAL